MTNSSSSCSNNSSTATHKSTTSSRGSSALYMVNTCKVYTSYNSIIYQVLGILLLIHRAPKEKKGEKTAHKKGREHSGDRTVDLKMLMEWKLPV